MNARFRNSFLGDIKSIRSKPLKSRINKVIQSTTSASKLSNIKKIKRYQFYYRIRVGDYRIGLSIDPSGNVWFERVLRRKNIYKKFPN